MGGKKKVLLAVAGIPASQFLDEYKIFFHHTQLLSSKFFFLLAIIKWRVKNIFSFF